MADQVRRVDHYDFEIENKPGAAAAILDKLRDNDVMLIAVWGYVASGHGHLGIVPEDANGFVAALKAAGIDAGVPTPTFYVTGSDRRGALAEHLDKLAKAGLNVGAAHAIADSSGGFGGLIYVDQANLQRAATALGARG